jgi:hypothetical protein
MAAPAPIVSTPTTTDPGPISPVSRSGTFPHKTSPAVATQNRLIDTATPAINAAPVELDSTPAGPEDLRRRNTGEENIDAANLLGGHEAR